MTTTPTADSNVPPTLFSDIEVKDIVEVEFFTNASLLSLHSDGTVRLDPTHKWDGYSTLRAVSYKKGTKLRGLVVRKEDSLHTQKGVLRYATLDILDTENGIVQLTSWNRGSTMYSVRKVTMDTDNE